MNIDLKIFFIYYNTSANTNELIKNWNNKAQGSSYKKSLCEGVCVCVCVCVCVGGEGGRGGSDDQQKLGPFQVITFLSAKFSLALFFQNHEL